MPADLPATRGLSIVATAQLPVRQAQTTKASEIAAASAE